MASELEQGFRHKILAAAVSARKPTPGSRTTTQRTVGSKPMNKANRPIKRAFLMSQISTAEPLKIDRPKS